MHYYYYRYRDMMIKRYHYFLNEFKAEDYQTTQTSDMILSTVNSEALIPWIEAKTNKSTPLHQKCTNDTFKFSLY